MFYGVLHLVTNIDLFFFYFSYDNHSRNISIIYNFSKKSRYGKKLFCKLMWSNSDYVHPLQTNKLSLSTRLFMLQCDLRDMAEGQVDI